MKLQILQDGNVKCLYTESLDLTEIGKLKVERASTVEFDNGKQLWVVRLPDGTEVYRNKSRAACLGWEENHILSYFK
jgi:hypothetical protein